MYPSVRCSTFYDSTEEPGGLQSMGSLESDATERLPFHFSLSLVAQTVKSLPAVQGTRVRSLGWEDPLEKEMATNSSILASKWGRKELDTTEVT